ncbi:MAG TPA: ACT domain-containing protein [Actinomycetota bacterium]|nr:ACT domain-containing protein [Actinomycetota bacterium]
MSVEDRPGTLADIGEALGRAGINIEGFAGFGVEGRGIIHLLVEDAAAARRALEEAGIKVEGEADAIVADMSADADRPGALGEAARRVANAGVNIRASYVATHNRGVIVTDDNERARQALGM